MLCTPIKVAFRGRASLYLFTVVTEFVTSEIQPLGRSERTLFATPRNAPAQRAPWCCQESQSVPEWARYKAACGVDIRPHVSDPRFVSQLRYSYLGWRITVEDCGTALIVPSDNAPRPQLHGPLHQRFPLTCPVLQSHGAHMRVYVYVYVHVHVCTDLPPLCRPYPKSLIFRRYPDSKSAKYDVH